MKSSRALGVLTALALCACSADPSGAPPRAAGGSERALPASGAYAFPQQDRAYSEVLAEAGQTGRPALLYFWTSW